ncbi:MAG: HD domain-containing protein, partial [Bdellovibrionota bacterium]
MLNENERKAWELEFQRKLKESGLENDPAHDIAHFHRVVTSAKRLCQEEKGTWEVVVPAAWLHDLVNVPKNDPKRSMASRLSATEATHFLEVSGYPKQYLPEIAHAIEAHSYSANIEPQTLESKIVQDADRLDGLGAIGIARCFAVTGLLRRKIYHPHDPWGNTREPDDLEFAIDHFFVKLFKTVETLKTSSGREEGMRRAEFMKIFLRQLGIEIGHVS